MDKSLTELLEWSKKVAMTPQQQEDQRRSFAYGNAKIENDRITREMIDSEADAMAATKKAKSGRSPQ